MFHAGFPVNTYLHFLEINVQECHCQATQRLHLGRNWRMVSASCCTVLQAQQFCIGNLTSACLPGLVSWQECLLWWVEWAFPQSRWTSLYVPLSHLGGPWCNGSSCILPILQLGMFFSCWILSIFTSFLDTGPFQTSAFQILSLFAFLPSSLFPSFLYYLPLPVPVPLHFLFLMCWSLSEVSAVLSNMHEDLSLDPGIYLKAREVVCICNLSAGKAQTASPVNQWLLSSGRDADSKLSWRVIMLDTWYQSVHYMCMWHACMHSHLHMCTS